MSASRVSVPTGSDDVRLVGRTVTLVLSMPVYTVVAIVGTAVALSVFVLSQNVNLFGNVILGGSLPLATRLEILVNLYPFVGTAFGPLRGSLLVLAAALTGVNLALLAYHLGHDQVTLRGGSGGVVGMTLGTLGAGCAACGSVLLTGLFSLFGATGLLAVLPLEGAEFTVLAVLALALSIYWLVDGMRGAEVAGCPVDVARD